MDTKPQAFGIEDRSELLYRCLEEGICPKGCGPLVVDDGRNRHCPVCGFKHHAFPGKPEVKGKE